ncbi:MAG: hypothetical protein H8K07_01535 [Nitrospira sp.]|nr:hypothetical protein [Nitrospira sp.]
MTIDEIGKAASLLGTGSWKREQMILNLLRQRSWTAKQRELVDKLFQEERARRQSTKERRCA